MKKEKGKIVRRNLAGFPFSVESIKHHGDDNEPEFWLSLQTASQARWLDKFTRKAAQDKLAVLSASQ